MSVISEKKPNSIMIQSTPLTKNAMQWAKILSLFELNSAIEIILFIDCDLFCQSWIESSEIVCACSSCHFSPSFSLYPSVAVFLAKLVACVKKFHDMIDKFSESSRSKLPGCNRVVFVSVLFQKDQMINIQDERSWKWDKHNITCLFKVIISVFKTKLSIINALLPLSIFGWSESEHKTVNENTEPYLVWNFRKTILKISGSSASFM